MVSPPEYTSPQQMSGGKHFKIRITMPSHNHHVINRAEALVQRLKLPAWKVGDAGSNPTVAFKFQRKKCFPAHS